MLNILKKFLRGLDFVRYEYLKYLFSNRSGFVSEFGEDKILMNLFKNYDKGFYMDIGCHHPISESNTFFLHKHRNWNGINIDLQKKTTALFNYFRPKDINMTAAISDVRRNTKAYIFGEGINCFNTLDHKFAKRVSKTLGEKYTMEEITTKTVTEILDTFQVTTIDYLNIDIEGLDLIVLKSFPFEKLKPSVISYENHANSFDENIAFMDSYGYQLVSLCGPTYFFVDTERKSIDHWPFLSGNKLRETSNLKSKNL